MLWENTIWWRVLHHAYFILKIDTKSLVPLSSMTILKRIQNVWNTWKISEINTFVLWGYIVESIRTTNTKWSDIPNWSTTFCVFRHLMRHCKVLSYQQFANNAGLVLRYPIKRGKIHQSDRTIVYIYDII